MAEQEMIPINIGNINDGAVIEAFDIVIQKIWANILDLNTPATDTRSLTIRVDFKPHSDRCTIETEVHCSSKLAPIEKHTSKCFMGKSEDGTIVAFATDPRQMPPFREVHPVTSKFLLRMKGVKDQLPQIALFEIDAKWKLYTVEAIRRYLHHELPDAKVIA